MKGMRIVYFISAIEVVIATVALIMCLILGNTLIFQIPVLIICLINLILTMSWSK